jgi:MFS family permease
MLIALFGFMTAQGVIWYTSFFYTQVFLEKMVRLDPQQKDTLIIGMTLVSAPLYIAFARLSDKIGRKPVMIFGMALACLTFFPGFNALMTFGNPDLAAASKVAPVVVVADPAQCTFQFDLLNTAQFTSPCDLAKSTVSGLGLPYTSQADASGTVTAAVKVGDTAIVLPSGEGLTPVEIKAVKAKAAADIKTAMTAAGYPDKADPEKANLWAMFAVLCVFAVACTALYGPMASALVEMFPTRVRYTAMSLPYNIGTGWFGGLQPALSFAMVAAAGNIYFGLWYPVATGLIAVVVALVFMKETKGRDLSTVE